MGNMGNMGNKVVDYEIHGGHFNDLTIKIKEKLKEGWQPFGKMYVFNGEVGTQHMICVQAIVKYKYEK